MCLDVLITKEIKLENIFQFTEGRHDESQYIYMV